VLYCGEVLSDDGKEKKVSIDFEPFKPINTSLYLCDNKFHCEALSSLLENDEKFGFIVMDGNGTLYGTLSGNTRTVLHKFTVDLPKKHGRGGQSSVRFARIRVEKRQNYVRKVAEMATQMFIQADKPTVVGLILAGSAEFKLKLNQSDIFDPRLQSIVLKIVDVSYGGENGFNQAIELASDCLSNIKFIREKKLLSTYFAEIAKDSGKYCFGVKDTLAALETGAVSDLIVYEDLSINRYVLRNKDTGAEKVVHLDETQEKNMANFKDTASGADLEVKDKMSLLDWFSTNFKNFGCKLQFISNRSQEGAQFCKGFGGIGGLLRYTVDFSTMETAEEEEEAGDGEATTGGADAWDDDDFI
jgi:peptide chain release factor subunit 1